MKLLAFLIASVGLPFLSQADETFATYDSNGDGVVTFAELLRKKDLELSHVKDDLSEPASSQLESLEELSEKGAIDFFATSEFTKFDTNADLRFSPVELGLIVRDLISQLDTNADNAVSEAEWETEKRKLAERETAPAE